MGGALEALLQLGLEAVVLLGGEVAVARGVDQRAGGPRGVVEQRLVPARGGVVDVDGGGGGLDGAQAVVVVGGMEQLHVQDAAHAGHRPRRRGARVRAGGGVFEGFGPAVGAGDDLHAVGAQRVQLAHVAADGDGFEVGVAGDEQEAVPGLEQVGRAGWPGWGGR